MKVLILGGTAWLGGVLARIAATRGHEVTCLARGESGNPPPGVRWVAADRRVDSAYDDVRDTDWDEVLDVSWQPGMVRSAVLALADRAAHWTHMSSCSVSASDDVPGADESAPVHPPLAADEAGWSEYGPAKSACEQAVGEALGDRVLVARAGLIGGRGDGSDRFGYWPARFAWAAEHPADADGAVLAPAALDQPTQTVHVDDLAEWLVDCAECRVGGTYNAVGEQVPLGDVLAAARAAAGHTGPLVTADPEWLLAQGIDFWMGPESLPLWLPGPEYAGHPARSDAAAVAAGLRRRPVADLVADALGWERELGLARDRKAGLTRARERELLGQLADGTGAPELSTG
ncbi:MAG: oxidoreductase [Streptosporangiales bacterium]|nr:oxidoreductase [Streptosporangiales bacterium]